MKLSVPPSRTEAHKHAFFPSAIGLWNSIPPSAPQAFKTIIEDWARAPCYRSGMYKTPVILPKVQVAGCT